MESTNLLELREQLGAELGAAITDGDADRMIRLDAQIKSLSPRIFAAQLADVQSILESNKNRKAEIKAEIESLREIRKARNKELAQVIELHERCGLAVTKIDFALQFAEQELESITVSNRELREKLESMKQEKLDEVKNERLYQ